MNKPDKTEYKPYFQKYIDLVQEGTLIELIETNTKEVVDFFSVISPDKADYKYAPGKWTVKEVFMHKIDTERGFSYRAIVCARLDGKIPLYPMDEDFYAANADVTDRTIESLVEEFLAVRKAFAFIFTTTSQENLKFLGNAVDSKISARALGFIALGHATHHMNVITERYLS